eukprot:scaffold182_cov350-Prasinococcus_capsulatus_cf.AAC.9
MLKRLRRVDHDQMFTFAGMRSGKQHRDEAIPEQLSVSCLFHRQTKVGARNARRDQPSCVRHVPPDTLVLHTQGDVGSFALYSRPCARASSGEPSHVRTVHTRSCNARHTAVQRTSRRTSPARRSTRLSTSRPCCSLRGGGALWRPLLAGDDDGNTLGRPAARLSRKAIAASSLFRMAAFPYKAAYRSGVRPPFSATPSGVILVHFRSSSPRICLEPRATA